MGPRLFSLGEVLCRFVSVTLYIHGGGGLPGHRTKITKGKVYRTWQYLGKQLAARIKIAAMVPRLEGRGFSAAERSAADLPLAGRPPTGASSCRCTTTATSFNRRIEELPAIDIHSL